MMSGTFNILITGTKAGIGYGLLSFYGSRPSTTIIAAIRDEPSSEEAQKMVSSVTVASRSKIIPVQYDASAVSSAQNLIKYLNKNHPEVRDLDLVVANAGVIPYWGPTHSAPFEDAITQYETFALGPLSLYQATRPLLLAAPEDRIPKFVLISSLAGSVTIGPNIPAMSVGYSMAKAAANFWVRKANFEEDRIVLVPVDPGNVRTKMGNFSATHFGLTEAKNSVDDILDDLVTIYEGVDKQSSFQTGLLKVGGDKQGSPW